MKKTLIALAVLAASGAAMAQSSVTMYGIADIYFANTSVDAGTGAGSLTKNSLDSGAVNGSRWGVKGSEDLGGGLKANFQLEQGFSMDTGAAASATATAFARQSWVGVSGNFGAVRLGRTLTPYDDADNGDLYGVLYSALDPSRNVFKSHSAANSMIATGATSRPDNSVYYQAPSFSGFSGAISYSLGEDKTAATDASSTTSLNLTYGAGPVAVKFGYQVQDTVNTVAAPSDKKFMLVGASYTLGSAILKASYGKAMNLANKDGADASDYQVAVDYVVSDAVAVTAAYARSADNDTAGGLVRKGFGLGAKYSLSKRTYVYGGYESDVTNKLVGDDAKHSVFAVGVQHRF